MPFIPGISTSSVMTSGRKVSIFARASLALKLVATTSMLGEVFRPLEIMVRARTESSTTMTRIFLLTGHMGITPFTGSYRYPDPVAGSGRKSLLLEGGGRYRDVGGILAQIL